jgi:hypothetical protein
MLWVTQAKRAAEVLDDATLVIYCSFDGNSLLDRGPLLINGTGSNYSFTAYGRANEALHLSTVPSYVHFDGLRRISRFSWPYTISIWICPTISSSGTIVHLSALPSIAWCLLLMGFTSTGQIAINSWSGMIVSLIGPTIPLLTWTHVVAT